MNHDGCRKLHEIENDLYFIQDKHEVDNSTAFYGEVQFLQESCTLWGDGGMYASEIIYNPSWTEVSAVVKKMIQRASWNTHVYIKNVDSPDGRAKYFTIW